MVKSDAKSVSARYVVAYDKMSRSQRKRYEEKDFTFQTWEMLKAKSTTVNKICVVYKNVIYDMVARRPLREV